MSQVRRSVSVGPVCSWGLFWVEVESSVGSSIEFLVETAAGGEAQGGRRLLGEAGVGGARRVELGGDAAAGEDGVPGGAGSGPCGLGAFVASGPGLSGGALDRAAGVA